MKIKTAFNANNPAKEGKPRGQVKPPASALSLTQRMRRRGIVAPPCCFVAGFCLYRCFIRRSETHARDAMGCTKVEDPHPPQGETRHDNGTSLPEEKKQGQSSDSDRRRNTSASAGHLHRAGKKVYRRTTDVARRREGAQKRNGCLLVDRPRARENAHSTFFTQNAENVKWQTRGHPPGEWIRVSTRPAAHRP